MNRCQLELHQLWPCTVIFDGVPFVFSLSANLDELQEWLQAESECEDPFWSSECNSTSVVCRSTLPSATEGKACLSSLQLDRSSLSFQYRSKFQDFSNSIFRIFLENFVRHCEEMCCGSFHNLLLCISGARGTV